MPESPRDQIRRVIDKKLVTIAFQPIVGLDHAGVVALWYVVVVGSASLGGTYSGSRAVDLGRFWQILADFGRF